MSTDFLILGSGIAGLTAALGLSEKGSVAIATKSSLLESSSRYAQAGIAAVRDFRWDSFEEHFDDTLTAGAHINDRKAVQFLVKNAPLAIDWLAELGMHFQAEPTREAAHSHSRVWNTRDSTGEAIEKVLATKVRARKNIKILTGTILLDFLMAKQICRGAVVKTGTKIYQLVAGQTVLATGGFGQLYARSTNPAVSVGDGLAAAYRAGAALKDLEFVQFHPTALVGKKIRLTLLSESLRGEGAVLRNARGERFMTAHHPAAELAPRDVVARAIFTELQKGSVFLDFTRAEAKWLKSRFPLIWHEVAKAGFNLAKDQIPIFPVAHYSCGGVVTNLKGETSIKNLFAVGEVAATGVHGANRLASNSLAEAVVFGRAAGAAGRQVPSSKSRIPKIKKYFFNIVEDKKILQIIRKEMWEHAGIVRSRAGLMQALQTLQKLKPKSLPALNAKTVAELIITAALRREKSVGTHFRID